MRIPCAFYFVNVLLGGLLSGCFFELGDRADLPPEPEPRIILGADKMNKEVLIEDTRLGSVSDIRVFPKEAPERFIGVTAEKGVLFLDRAGKVTEFLPLGDAGQHVEFIRPARDSRQGYIGISTWHNAQVLDGAGKLVWTVESHLGVDDVAAGDVDGDGDVEFVAGFNAWGGVRLYDDQGKELWKQGDGNVWHVECLDSDGDGKDEIVHSNAGGEMVFRDAGGAVVKQGRPSGYFSSFSLSAWPDLAGKQHILSAEDDTIQLYGASGDPVASFQAPLAGSLGDAYGTPVVFAQEAAPYFAAVVELRDRAVLYVYADQNTLIYHEVLPEPTSAIAAVTLEGRGEVLLVGGRNKVLAFQLKG